MPLGGNSDYVILEPASRGTEDLGPLLSTVDLIVERSPFAFVVDVRYAEDSDSNQREQARATSNLQTTTRALIGYKERLGIRSANLIPLMVFLGGKAEPAVRQFAEKHGILILEIDEHVLNDVSDSDQPRQVAHKLLNPLDDSANLFASQGRE